MSKGIILTDMGKELDENSVTKSDSTADSTIVILQTIGDTTWRMFVPSVGFTLFGVWLDSVFGTKPWLMVAGIVIGAAGAVLLVREQMKRLKRTAK